MNEQPYLQQLDAERQEQRTGAVKQIEAIRGLLSSDGWGIVRGFLQEQIARRDAELYSNPGCENPEYLRGEGGILRLVLRFPDVVLDQATQVVQALNQERENAAGSRTKRSSSADADDTSGWTADDD
jgi:hypothetical protein